MLSFVIAGSLSTLQYTIMEPPPLPAKPPGGALGSPASPAPSTPVEATPVPAQSNSTPYTLSHLDELATQHISSVPQDVLKGSIVAENGGDYSRQTRALKDLEQRAQKLKEQYQETLPELRQRVGEKVTASKKLEGEWVQLEAEMYRALQPFSSPALQSSMTHSAVESDELSEILRESFLGSDSTDVAQFVSDYRQARSRYHLRHERAQRWKEERVART
jgi:hypothetical protein